MHKTIIDLDLIPVATLLRWRKDLVSVGGQISRMRKRADSVELRRTDRELLRAVVDIDNSVFHRSPDRIPA